MFCNGPWEWEDNKTPARDMAPAHFTMNMTIDPYSKWKYKKPGNTDSSLILEEEQRTPLSGARTFWINIRWKKKNDDNNKIKINPQCALWKFHKLFQHMHTFKNIRRRREGKEEKKPDWLISRFPSAVRSIFCASLVGRSVYPRHLCRAYQAGALFEHVTV